MFDHLLLIVQLPFVIYSIGFMKLSILENANLQKLNHNFRSFKTNISMMICLKTIQNTLSLDWSKILIMYTTLLHSSPVLFFRQLKNVRVRRKSKRINGANEMWWDACNNMPHFIWSHFLLQTNKTIHDVFQVN